MHFGPHSVHDNVQYILVYTWCNLYMQLGSYSVHDNVQKTY